MRGYVQCYIGNGKGKTTAAVGLCIRASAAGRKIYFAQFLKDNRGNELKILRGLPNFILADAPQSLPFFWKMTREQKNEYSVFATGIFDEAINSALAGDVDIVVLDEILDAADLGIIPREKLIDFLSHKPENVEVVITGHVADEEIVSKCDYVSEIKAIKHPFDKGVPAREGIEF